MRVAFLIVKLLEMVLIQRVIELMLLELILTQKDNQLQQVENIPMLKV